MGISYGLSPKKFSDIFMIDHMHHKNLRGAFPRLDCITLKTQPQGNRLEKPSVFFHQISLEDTQTNCFQKTNYASIVKMT